MGPVDREMTRPDCLRCQGRPLDPVVVEGAERKSFWSCGGCSRQFTMHEDGELTERWMGPISRALYGVIFEADPVSRVGAVAAQLELTPAMLDEIELELARPTQKVSRIVNMVADEDSVRAYLRALVARFRGASS